MIKTQYINLDMVPSGVFPVLYCSQYDVGRPLGMVVYNRGEAVNLSTYTCTIEATRTDGTAITVAVTTDGNIAAFTTTATMTNQKDKYPAKLVLFDSQSRRVASLAFVMMVTPATMDENAEGIEEDKSLYQQYTETVQSLIAEIREDIETLRTDLNNRTTLSYKDFGAVGDGVTNDYEAIKACHLAANAANVPIVNYGGTYYATGAAIPVATDVYNYGVTFLVGNSNFGDNPLFLMSHDSETSVSNVLLSSVFSDQDTVTAAYKDKAFVVTTHIALGTSSYTGQTGEVVEEAILACGTQAELVMEKYATASGWTVDINHITDATEHGYTWHGGTIKQKDESTWGICFLKVARNNCRVEGMSVEVANATAQNTIIYGYTSNNLTISDIVAMTDTDGTTWGNYSVSVIYAANLLVRNLKSSAHTGGSSTVSTRCIKNYTLRDSVTRTFDVHWNAFGAFLVEGCTISDSAHLGYGDGVFTIKSSVVTGSVDTRKDFVPLFRGNIVFEDSIVGFVYIAMPSNDDNTRDMEYFAKVKPPKYYLNRIKFTSSRYLFWSGINQIMEALLDGSVEVQISNMPIGAISNAYGNKCFRMTAKNATGYGSIHTWQTYGVARTDSAYKYTHTAPTFVDGVSISGTPTIQFYERGGSEHLTCQATITANVAAWEPVMQIADMAYTPDSVIYFTGCFGDKVIPMYVSNDGKVVPLVNLNGTNQRLVFCVTW